MKVCISQNRVKPISLAQLTIGTSFIKNYHDIDSIINGTYNKPWSLFVVLPKSKYLDERPTNNGGVYIYNVTKNSIHCIAGHTEVTPVDAEAMVIRRK